MLCYVVLLVDFAKVPKVFRQLGAVPAFLIVK